VPWQPGGELRFWADIKTHLAEQHWLQNSRGDCNPGFTGGTYQDCEPFYFNHGLESVSVTSVYDSRIQGLGVREAEMACSRNEAEAGFDLWPEQIPGWDNNGYFSGLPYDWSNTCHDILTTDGIRGRHKRGD
jgi:hypothetical protein